MTDLEGRLAALEERLRLLEDEREITRLILSYGPLVDSGCAGDVAALWDEDGVYDVDEILMTGRDEIDAMVRSAGHQGWIGGGCAHVAGPPHVTVSASGDEATAIGYTLMIVNRADGFVLRRATANRWRLRRTPSGWRVTDRTSRVLDGRDESPGLLAAHFPGAVRHRPPPAES
ncbi:nuclear transport factor 2 family protein [Actinomadura sp. 3N508]|uniref:nuclear transport factor 2 family protein n=1 Tax=Actinomadura sp. 3N508 TaxID=3375153 RepID=UPI00379C46FE